MSEATTEVGDPSAEYAQWVRADFRDATDSKVDRMWRAASQGDRVFWRDLVGELAGLRAERDKAYRERAALVAYLSANYPSEVVEAPGAFADEWPLVYVDTPSGQMTWHIARADLDLFSHLRRVIDAAPGWDGHTTEEKYQRLAELTLTVATGLYGPQPSQPDSARDALDAQTLHDSPGADL